MPSDDSDRSLDDRSLDEAREILFGAHHRAHEIRLTQVEATLAAASGEGAARADAVERRLALRIDQVVAQLTDRIATLEAELRSCHDRLQMLEGENLDETADD